MTLEEKKEKYKKVKIELVDDLDSDIEVKFAEVDIQKLYEEHKRKRNERVKKRFERSER